MYDSALRPSDSVSVIDLDQLRQRAVFQETILKTLSAVVVVFDIVSRSEVRIVYMNRDTGPSGIKKADILGKRIEEYMLPEEAAVSYQRIQTCMDSGKSLEVEDSYTLPNGVFHMELSYAPLRDDADRVTRMLLTIENVSRRKEREQNEQQRQAELIEQQAAALAELSTPLLTISDTTLVMPLIGAIDTRRVRHIMEVLLSGVAERRARTVIIDITGVSVVDTQVANALIQSAQAVKLLGAEAILTGLRPEVAQTLVQLGVSLQGVVTRGTLQDGIAYALHR